MRRLAPRFAALAGVAGLVAGSSCASASARSPGVEAELEGFYAAWDAEVRTAARELDPGGRAQLVAVWPRAEFEGETEDVLRVLEEAAELGPVVRRWRRFLNTDPSNRIRSELATRSGRDRVWKILVDAINAELGLPPSTS